METTYSQLKSAFIELKKIQHKTPQQLQLFKSVNQQLAYLAHRDLKATVLDHYPIKLTICPTNICNLKCRLCPASADQIGTHKGKMKLSTFKKILDDCGPTLKQIDLYNWGEPLLNPSLFKMVQYAHQYDVPVSISTNLQFLPDKLIHQLFESKCDELIFSLAGVTQSSVEKYQTGIQVSKTLKNLSRIVNERKSRQVPYPKLTWRYIVNRHNESEMEQARNLRTKLGVNRLEFGPIRCDMAKELFLTNEHQFNTLKDWLPVAENNAAYNYASHQKKQLLGNDCNWLWSQSTINWDGSVVPCCAVWDNRYQFGNILETRFSEIWNNTAYQTARAHLSSATTTTNPDASSLICQICKSNQAQIL